MSELALQIIAENRAKHARGEDASYLDLGNCGLTEVPDLSGMEWLETLIVSNEWVEFEEGNWKQRSSSNNGPSNDLKALPLWLGALQGLQELLISGLAITSLDPLKKLANLRVLDCSSAQINDLSPIAGLTQLQKLYCSSAQINDLSPIAGLTQLQHLDCSSTQINDLSPIAGLTQLQHLDCSSTQINDLSPIAGLTQLQQLDCSSTQINDLSPIAGLTQLQHLYCWSTQINDLSPIAGLTQLQHLDCSSTQINDLSPIAGLTQLQQLDCSSTQINDLSPIAGLTQLQQLNCWSTQINDLSPIAGLTQLQKLYCSSTQINDLSPIAGLTQLQHLYCWSTQINDLSPIAGLTQLQHLDCSSTQINDLSPIAGLTQLQQLNCSSTQINDLSPIAGLTQLQQLYCSSTQINDLSPIAGLTQLQRLDCSSTQINDLSPIAGLTQLQRLDCSSTQINDLSPIAALNNLAYVNIAQTDVTDLTPLKSMIASDQLAARWEDAANPKTNPGLLVKGCPLDKTLIAAIKAGKEAVLEYLNKPKERLWEARVLILGEPRAGKTTLRRKLRNVDAELPARTESTRGIEVEIEKLLCKLPIQGQEQKVKYHLWDFGGQDMYRLLHQLFVSEQAVYIIVVNTDTNDNIEEAAFWLETIERLSRDKNGGYGPVLLLQNAPHNRVGRSFRELQRRFQAVWQQPDDIVINLGAISRKSEQFKKTERDKFLEFKNRLENQFVKLDRLGQEMPRAWVRIRRKLEATAKERNWIPVEDYWAICQKENIRKRQEQNDVLKIFHTLGLILHYPESDALRGMIILNREWATDALYRVLDSELVTENKGWFRRTDARLIWDEDKYAGRENDLLELMKQFKLCYLHPTSDRYIVPSKLPEYPDNLPDWGNQAQAANTRLQLRYNWLPKAIPIQLMVSLHDHLVALSDNRQWIWQKGAVIDGRHLDLPDTQLRIIDKGREKQMIEINVRGAQSEKLVNLVMQAWRPINKPFEEKVSTEIIILCNCAQCSTATQPFEFRYEQVLNAIKLRKPLHCNDALIEISPQKLLNNVFDDITIKADAIGLRTPLIEDILNNNIGKALDRLEGNNVTLKISGRYRQLKKDIAAGILSQEERTRQENELRSQLIDYVSGMYERAKMGSDRHEMARGESSFHSGIGREPLSDATSYVIHNYAGGQVNIRPDTVIPYNPDWGISRTDFGILTDELQKLSPEQKEQAEQLLATDAPISETQKPGLGEKVIAFLNQHSIPVVQNLMASSYYDIMKLFLGGS